MRRNVLILVASFAVLVAIAVVVALLVPSKPAGLRKLPDPNGYDTLVQAAQMVVGNVEDHRQLPLDELRAHVADNATALQLVRAGLQEESLVPWQPTTSYLSNHMVELAGWKPLGRVLVAEGMLAELENRWTDAARAYLEVIDLGITLAKGGLLIDALVGLAIETMGIRELESTSSRLDAAMCAEIASALADLDHNRASWKDVMDQEQTWSRETFPGLQYRFMAIVRSKTMKAAVEKGEERVEAAQKRMRQVTVDFAAQAYELEKGSPPAGPGDLVPLYLKAIPLDPVTGKELGLSP